MEIVINGQRERDSFTNVEDLLKARDLAPSRVVVELNGKILPKDDYAAVSLADGDTVEIVEFVAGG